jgi:hypothetical protein
MGVLECSLANAFIPSLLLPLALLARPEYHNYPEELGGHSTRPTVIITLLCITITMAKHMDRLSKFSIVSQASTMFYAVIDSNMKIIAGIGTFVLFDESIYWPQVVGFICIFISLCITCYDKKIKYDAEQADEATKGRFSTESEMSVDVLKGFPRPTTPDSSVLNPIKPEKDKSNDTDDTAPSSNEGEEEC